MAFFHTSEGFFYPLENFTESDGTPSPLGTSVLPAAAPSTSMDVNLFSKLLLVQELVCRSSLLLSTLC